MVRKILVADNSITIQKIVSMAFEKEDFEVEGVGNGKDAFDRMEDFHPDIVLADIDMPDLTGFELSKKIKADLKFNSTKVLLLASDFEDFNESLFKDSGADDHISKPFKSEDLVKKVVALLSENTPDPDEELIKLAVTDLEEAIEPAEATIELSMADLEETTDEAIEEKEHPATTESKEKVVENSFDKDSKDAMFSEEIPADAYADENELGEAAPSQENEIGDELDTAFREIVRFGLGKEPSGISNIDLEPIDNSSAVDNIIPEPENLLEKMTPSTLGRKKGISGPNLIRESLSYLSQVAREPKNRQNIASHRTERLKDINQPMDTNDDHIAGDHVRQILEESLNTTIEKEMAGLSNSITQSVREVVREITPKIAREIIKEEIDKIKKL